MADTRTWVELAQLIEELKCSERTIYDLKRAGLIRPGIDFYVAGKSGKHGKRVYCLECIRDAMLKHTAEAYERELQRIQSQETVDLQHLAELSEKNVNPDS